MNATPFLGALLDALTADKLEDVLIGNAAAAILGAPVTTLDFDVMFRDTVANLAKLKRVALRSPPRTLLFRRRLGDWQADLPEATFVRPTKSLPVKVALLARSEWRSRDETNLIITGHDAPLTVGRIAASRLREVLAVPPGDATW